MIDGDNIIVTLEVDLGNVDMDEALSRAKTKLSQIRDPNEDNAQIKSIRRE